MATLSLDTTAQNICENESCHIVPCNIKLTGKCNVSKYFTPYICEENGYLKCSLRGHPLCGQKIPIPDGYTGVIFKENKKLSTEDKRDLKMSGTFKEFISWNWDKIPSSEDKLVKALQWIDVATALHMPVSEYEETPKSLKAPLKRKHAD